MNGAAAVAQKMALRLGRLAQSKEIPCSVDKLLLELKTGQANEFRYSGQVVLAKIDKPLLIATVNTSPLALKPQIQP